MKKLLLLTGLATAIFATQATATEISPYVSAKLKYVDISGKYSEPGYSFSLDDNIFGGSIAAGTSIKMPYGAVRTELEYNQNDTAKKKLFGIIKTELETQSIMVNAYYDIDTGTKITPYLGGGIGYSKIKGKMSVLGLSAKMDDNTFTWQLGAGASYALTNNISLDAGYRYVDYGDFNEYDSKIDATSNELYIGARYTF